MSKYKYIMFDLDGTLIDPKIGQINAIDYALQYFNIDEPNKESLCKFIGLPLKESFVKYYSFNNEQVKIGIEKYREYILNKGLKEANVYNGIIKMLNKCTNIYGFKDYLFDICGSNLDGTRVIKQELIEYAISKNNIKDKTSIVMVGDRISDIIGAKSTQIDSIGVLYGYGTAEEMEEAMPNYKVKTVEELEKILMS